MKTRLFGGDSYLNLTFSERVVVLASLIPAGYVVTYGDIAVAAGGGAMAAQSITAILGRMEQKTTFSVPYHRVVYANGRVWLTEPLRAERLRLYQKEGIRLTAHDVISDFVAKRFDFAAVTPAQLARQIRLLRKRAG